MDSQEDPPHVTLRRTFSSHNLSTSPCRFRLQHVFQDYVRDGPGCPPRGFRGGSIAADHVRSPRFQRGV